MEYIKINNNEYITVKDAYLNLCVSRNSIIKKIKCLEKTGDILRQENKRPEIYISKRGYQKLKEERTKYLNKMIDSIDDEKLKEYYKKLKDAIEKPNQWDDFHGKVITHYIYFE